MNAMAVSGISMFIWLLLVPSVIAQCQVPDFGLEDSNIVARLDVECNEVEVKLNVSSGGISVSEVHIFQECVTGYNISDVASSGEPQVTQVLYDYFRSAMDEREISVPQNSVILADMECSYYGCYLADTFPYVLTLTAETECTFTKEIQQAAAPSSSLPRHTETSMNTATLIHHTSTQRMSSTAAMTSMQQSSVSALQLQSTPVTLSNKELTSISHQSPDTPTPSTLAIVTQENGNGSLQWMALLILFPIVLFTLLGFCLVLRKVDLRQEKNKFRHDIHTEWTKWQNEEPLNVNFFPVLIDLQLKSPSLYSLETVVNELECSSTSSSHTAFAGDSVQSTNITQKINSSISCVLDVDQNSDSDSEEHLQEQQIFHTKGKTGEMKAKNLHPAEAVPEGSTSEVLTQIVDPTANVYNYSLDSREYVLVSSLSYNGGSGSTTFTTIASHHKDSCAQHQSCDNNLS